MIVIVVKRKTSKQIVSFVIASLLASIGLGVSAESTVPKMESVRTAAKGLLSDTSKGLGRKEIKRVFGSLISDFGVENRDVVAQVLAEFFPDEKAYVAKRALYYSPIKANDLVRKLGFGDSTGAVTAQNILSPVVSVSSGSGRNFVLPQVDQRRRVVSVKYDSKGRVIEVAGGSTGFGLPSGSTLTASLGPVQDNGFTLDGLGYTVLDQDKNLVGIYLEMTVDPGNPNLYHFKYKCIHVGVDPGPGALNLDILVQ